MPELKPNAYTAAELIELYQMIADAADDDPGEAGEVLHLTSAAQYAAYLAGGWVIDPQPIIRLI